MPGLNNNTYVHVYSKDICIMQITTVGRHILRIKIFKDSQIFIQPQKYLSSKIFAAL